MQAVLVMFRSDGERRSFSVTRDVTVIGRREDCDLRIPLGDVSRKHARVIKEGDQLRIEDLGSSNGTHLNGQRIERDAILQPGDSIQVGPVVFVLQVDGYPSDDELHPITAETAAAAAMFAAPGEEPLTDEATAPGGYEGGAYAEPGQYAEEGVLGEEGQPAEQGQFAEGELDQFEPLEEAPASELDLMPLEDEPLDPAPRQPRAAPAEQPLELSGEEPLSLDDDDALALSNDEPLPLDEDDALGLAPSQPPPMQAPPMQAPPMRAPPVQAPPIQSAEGAAEDDGLIPLADDEPIPLEDADAGYDMLEEGESEQQAEDELMIDMDEPEKK